MTPQRRVKVQVWLLIVLVFALGGVTGAAIDRFLMRPAGEIPGRSAGPNRYLNALKQDLKLNEAQEKSIREILDGNRKEFRSLMSECTGMADLRTKTDARIKALLTPEQQTHFDELQAHRNAEMNKK